MKKQSGSLSSVPENAGHGGGDDYIMKELYDVMIHGGEPKCSGNEGLESAVSALALDRAMREERVVDLEPIWKKNGALSRRQCHTLTHGVMTLLIVK